MEKKVMAGLWKRKSRLNKKQDKWIQNPSLMVLFLAFSRDTELYIYQSEIYEGQYTAALKYQA